MNIGFIGAGKVGCTFGRYLNDNGFAVKGYYSRSRDSAIRGAEGVEGKVYSTIQEILNECNIIFITTPDDTIQKVVSLISQENKIEEEQIFVHMSGALSSAILSPLKEKGAYIYSLHPLQAFSNIETAYKALSKTVFSIEGDEEKLNKIYGIIKKCGNECIKIKKEQKPLYHAAACVVSNYLVTLLDYGFRYFEVLGIDKEITIKALYPLIAGTVENVRQLGPSKALTGPIARGDANTIAKHIENLKHNSPELVQLYKILGLETMKLVQKEKSKDSETITKLKKLLKEV